MTVTWPEMFLRQNFSTEQILRVDYLCGVPIANGTYYCKPCGRSQTGSRQVHFEQHVREYEAFDKARRLKIEQERRERLHPNSKPKVKQEKGEFYEHPCTSCGARITRTGKRGAPPKQCEACKTKTVAAPTDKVTCKHKKTDGSKCGMKPLKNSEFCRWHQEK